MTGDVSLWFGSFQAAAAEHIVEGCLELPTEAWVDNGVNAAVEVTQPEGYFKDGFRGFIGWENRSQRTQETQIKQE